MIQKIIVCEFLWMYTSIEWTIIKKCFFFISPLQNVKYSSFDVSNDYWYTDSCKFGSDIFVLIALQRDWVI